MSLAPLQRRSEAKYRLIVKLRNTLDEPCSYRRIFLGSQSTAYFEPASAVIGDIQPQADAESYLDLVQRSRVRSFDLPRVITLNLQTTDPQIILQEEKQLETAVSIERLIELVNRPERSERNRFQYNIVLLGPPDSAKSSFINSVCTMLSKAVKTVAIVGGGAAYTTTRILRYDLSRAMHLGIHLFDTFAITSDSYTGDTSLSNLLKGRIPVNASKDYTAGFSSPGEERVPVRRRKSRRHMHSVVVFVSAEYQADPSTEEEEAIATAIRKTTEERLNPVVVLSKADLVGDGLIDTKCAELAREFGIPRSSVFPFESYHQDNILDYRKDHMTYCILEEAIMRAIESCDHLEETAIYRAVDA